MKEQRMAGRQISSILSVTGDEAIRSTVNDVVGQLPHAKVTNTATGAEALKIDTMGAFNLVIASIDLSGIDGFELANRMLVARCRPVVLVGEMPRAQDIVWAMRVGVADLLQTPLQACELSDALERCLGRVADARRARNEHQKLRNLFKRAMDDRRDLSRRIDLVCRDLVGTQRRLFHRVLNLEQDLNSSFRT